MESKSENTNNSCSNKGQQSLHFPIIPPIVLSHIARNKLDGFKYAADDMMLKNRKPFSFSDDMSVTYKTGIPTGGNSYVKNIMSRAVEEGSFQWMPEEVSLAIGTDHSLAIREMLGKDGKILPHYKKQILAAIGYYHLKLQIKKAAKVAKKEISIPDNPFIILRYSIMVNGNQIFENMHIITMFHDL